jgi:hypothetical protein
MANQQTQPGQPGSQSTTGTGSQHSAGSPGADKNKNMGVKSNDEDENDMVNKGAGEQQSKVSGNQNQIQNPTSRQ